MKRLTLATMMIALALFFILPACGGGSGSGGSNHSVAGSWQASTIDGVAVPLGTLVFAFNSDGTGEFAGLGYTRTFTWSQDGNTLTLTENGQSETLALNWISNDEFQAVYDGTALTLVRN